MAEWRKLTVQCTASLRDFDGWIDVKSLRDSIFEYLKHFVPKRKDLEALRDEIRDLCYEALKFALRIRQSRSAYQVVSIEGGKRLDGIKGPDWIVEGSEDPKLTEDDIKGAQVSYTLFGALMRYDYGQGEPVVQESAMVIFKKSPRS